MSMSASSSDVGGGPTYLLDAGVVLGFQKAGHLDALASASQTIDLLIVEEVYDEITRPVLDAAHIQPYLGPRSNHVQNGLVLTKEFHALFDAGYVAVTPDYEVRISERLRADWKNGRTARAVSYLVLSARLGLELPGRIPIPARLKHAPIAYTRALEAADVAWARGELDVSAMESLLAFFLEAQLADAPPTLPPW